MTPAEFQHFTRLPPAAAQAYFHRLWTLKESLLKCLGTGLSLDPRSLTLRLDTPAISAVHASRSLAGLTFLELPMPADCRAALCYA